MLTTIKGIYDEGKITLTEEPPVTTRTEVMIEEFDIDFQEFIQSIYTSGFKLLKVKNEHFETYNQIELPEIHRDPFDRYLIAAAQFEDLAILTKDENFNCIQSK